MAQSQFSKRSGDGSGDTGTGASIEKHGRDWNGSRGFTIIEVLVASFILIVGLTAVAGSYRKHSWQYYAQRIHDAGGNAGD